MLPRLLFNEYIYVQNYIYYKARVNSKYFAKLVKNQLEKKFVYDKFQNPTNLICMDEKFIPKSDKCDNYRTSIEGPSAWNEAINVLNNQPNVGFIKWSEGLSQACYDHIQDIGPKGKKGHIGSDGSTPSERINKYTINSGVGENIFISDFHQSEDFTLQMLIDDGVSDRSNRNNIINPKFTHVGTNCGCHAVYYEIWWYAFGIDVKEKDPSLVADSAPFLKECTPYTSQTKGTEDPHNHYKNISKESIADANIPYTKTEIQIKPHKMETRNLVSKCWKF